MGGSSVGSYLADLHPPSPATVHKLSRLALLRVNAFLYHYYLHPRVCSIMHKQHNGANAYHVGGQGETHEADGAEVVNQLLKEILK